jgi:hypothetical protein
MGGCRPGGSARQLFFAACIALAQRFRFEQRFEPNHRSRYRTGAMTS